MAPKGKGTKKKPDIANAPQLTIKKTKAEVIIVKKPAAKATAGVDTGEEEGNLKDFYKVSIDKKLWQSMSGEEKKQWLRKMGPCPRNVYNSFHKSMASAGTSIPDHFKNEYERIMQLKHKKGVTTQKVADLQNLCKQWWLASKDPEGNANTAKVSWDSCFISQTCHSTLEQILSEKEETYTWGQIVGMFFGEKLALAALKRKEVEAVTIKDSKGKVHKRFTILNFSGWSVIEYVSLSCKFNKPHLCVCFYLKYVSKTGYLMSKSGYLIYKLGNLIYKLGNLNTKSGYLI